jgi:two-component system, OmpR family, sensor kinase
LTLAQAEPTGSPPQPVDLAEMVAERLAAWSPLAEERAMHLEGDLPRPLPVWSAPDRLDQVLDNLLANALEVAPPASRITLTGGRSGDLVELHVVDRGPGLSPDDRERAFDRFWRGATPPDGQGGGFGLGLAIVRQLLVSDAGSIELRPAPGTGLDVVLRLRAVTADSVS